VVVRRAVSFWREACASASEDVMLQTALFGTLIAAASFAGRVPDPLIVPPATKSPGALRTETVDISNGGELVILFEKLPAGRQTAGESEMPLLAF
jgi:hypothetical protein